eukprot:2471492-Alexandrium_andersonii.AAC.1
MRNVGQGVPAPRGHQPQDDADEENRCRSEESLAGAAMPAARPGVTGRGAASRRARGQKNE